MPASGTDVASHENSGQVRCSHRLSGSTDILRRQLNSPLFLTNPVRVKGCITAYGWKFAPAHGDAYSMS